jgi:hypothetical protein
LAALAAFLTERGTARAATFFAAAAARAFLTARFLAAKITARFFALGNNTLALAAAAFLAAATLFRDNAFAAAICL